MQKQMTYIVFAIFALTLTILGIDTYAQVVHFPDPNLRAAVAEKIGVDPDHITQAALQRLTRLGVLDREIENLEGLQYASNLRLLNLSSNRISDLTPLANLHSLEELELDKNVIKDVSPLAGLTNLLVLTLRRNLITDIEPLRDLARLQVLVIEHNSITDISPLGRLTNLRILKMPYNSISALTPLANLTNLEELLLNDNRISDVEPLRGLTNLHTLKIENNLIVDHSPLDGLTISHFTYDANNQVVHFPDPNLRAAIAEKLGVDPDRITEVALQRLTRLGIVDGEIESLEGLQHAPNLRLLDLSGNPISDLTPLANLTNLVELLLHDNRISDLTPLANLHSLDILILNGNDITDISPLGRLTNLWVLKMAYNGISDLTPLANLTNLEELVLDRNRISDISPLAGLTKLRVLHIQHNFIRNHSPVDGLSLETFLYDQICDMPAEPLEPRLENRSFPSIFASFTPQIVNKNEDATIEMLYHDMIFTGWIFRDVFRVFDGEWHLVGVLPHMVDRRDQFLARNPNMIFVLEVRIFDAGGTSPHDAFPDDHPYWLRDTNGQIALSGVRRLINFAHPDVQDIIVGQALAIAKCGLYDGVFFDHWKDFGSVGDLISLEDAQRARENIVRRIREGARDNFLIFGNTNDRIIPITGPFMNAGFMESIVPAPGVQREPSIRRVRESLEWLENNLREPRLVMLQGGTDPSEPPDSPYNRRLMRATTTMSLTHSDGYTQFGIDSSDDKFWYDFWDADLGRPVGPKSQFYKNVEGLYIREFDNGWAVYNQSGEAQVVTLPEEVQSVVSGLVSAEHAVLNIDGDIFLKVRPANPADVNGDGTVNILDLTLVAQAMGTDKRQGDVNGDGVINVFDLVFVANQF